ncbi:DUF4265 domain-containing protein [Amycolatopsis sp. NPDC051045]|uniref:DUF4265 domain-containing protein n=1 Tax=Amycolatopsis sp. NPDC051045 TaxID=3156922 RepID=UPI003432719D
MVNEIVYVTHEDPVWRPEPAYIALVDLAPFGLDGQQEQVWLKPSADGGLEVACIPFCAYGMALGDRVALADERFVARVVARSGRRVFRVFFTEPRPPGDAREALRTAIAEGGFLAEWQGDRHVAIDVPEGAATSAVWMAVREEIENQTAYWEWADGEPFRTTADA